MHWLIFGTGEDKDFNSCTYFLDRTAKCVHTVTKPCHFIQKGGNVMHFFFKYLEISKRLGDGTGQHQDDHHNQSHG